MLQYEIANCFTNCIIDVKIIAVAVVKGWIIMNRVIVRLLYKMVNKRYIQQI